MTYDPEKVRRCPLRAMHDLSLAEAYCDPDPECYQRARTYCGQHGVVSLCDGCGVVVRYVETDPPKPKPSGGRAVIAGAIFGPVGFILGRRR